MVVYRQETVRQSIVVARDEVVTKQIAFAGEQGRGGVRVVLPSPDDRNYTPILSGLEKRLVDLAARLERRAQPGHEICCVMTIEHTVVTVEKNVADVVDDRLLVSGYAEVVISGQRAVVFERGVGASVMNSASLAAIADSTATELEETMAADFGLYEQGGRAEIRRGDYDILW